MNYLVNLNLLQNELQNAVLQPLATAPSNPNLGQIYYNSTDSLAYIYDGSAWKPIGAVTSVAGKTGVVTLVKGDVGLGNVDNTSDATKKTNFTGSIADGNTGFVTGDDAYDALALKLNLSGGTMSGDINMGSNNFTGLGTPTNDTDAVPKKYVDDAVAGGVHSATGTIGTSATSASVSYSGTLVNAYALQGGEIIQCDIAVAASSVTFSVAAAPSSAITCVVIYA